MAKALVVDDSRAVRVLLCRHMRDLGYEVREASNGLEALEVLRAENGGVSLVLTDWNMPEMNGYELLQQLRRNPELSAMVVVMVTTESEMDHMSAALEAGANEYIMKPFTRDVLAEKLELVGIHPA